MSLFQKLETMGHEQVVYSYDTVSGLKSIIAIHDTTLGPALGGTRLLPYESEEEALNDVLRLSRGMTFKAACAGLNLGGGKAVIIADPRQKSEALWRTYGRFVQSLGGRYITAEDMNTNVNDMDLVRLETKNVVGVSKVYGGSGDPSTFTALGIYCGMKASVQYKMKKENLNGVKISIQGYGSVGKQLCELLHKDGAKLFIHDMDEKKLEDAKNRLGATIISENELYCGDYDVYSPSARGATINDEHLKVLKSKVIAGCANNQLEDENNHSKMLQEMKILYAPDFVINAGGLINVANEISGYNLEKAQKDVSNIANTLLKIYEDADKRGLTTQKAALEFAQKRVSEIRALKNLRSYKL